MIKFGNLDIGDHFEFQDIHWELIPLIKGGSCGCVPMYNARGVEDTELFTFLSSGHKVVKIEVFRTHYYNYNEVDHRTRYYKRHIVINDDLPIESEASIVEPTIQDEFVEYEETDLWLAYFGLGKIRHAPYYERLEHGQFVSEN